ncbi:MAG: hypothetical protein ACI89J_003502 [Hyphomicrobiaceae bacterium]|jgi:hypothetical protein
MTHHKRRGSLWRCFLLLLIPVMILFAGPVGQALAEAKDICRSFAVQPKTFAKLKFVKSKRYDKKEFGVFIKFGARNQVLSIFKYDNGQTHITDAFLQKMLKSSQKSIEKSVTKRGDKIVSRSKPLVWKMGDVLFHGASYRVTYKKHKLSANEYVGLSHNTACMLKVRYTDALKTKRGTSLKRYKSYTREAHELFE